MLNLDWNRINKIKEDNFNTRVKVWYWEGNMDFVELVEKNQSENMIVVEIGCHDGSTTRQYIETVRKNNGKVFVVDTFDGTIFSDTEKSLRRTGFGEHREGWHNKGLYEVFLKKFESYSDVLTIIRGKVEEVIDQLPNNCDIVFIDACHTYKSVKRDIDLALPKVKQGGIICGDDLETFEYVDKFEPWELDVDCTEKGHCGVAQAVYEKFGITELIGSGAVRGKVWYVNV